MRAQSFLDTNVLVHAAAGRGAEERKRRWALALVESEDVGTSAQVLHEFYVTVIRKLQVPMSSAEARPPIAMIDDTCSGCLESGQSHDCPTHTQIIGNPGAVHRFLGAGW